MSILMVATVIQGSVLKRVMSKYLRIDVWHVHLFLFFSSLIFLQTALKRNKI